MSSHECRLVICSLGYAGAAVAAAARKAGWQVTASSRRPGEQSVPEGVQLVEFAAAGAAIQQATHLIATVPPDDAGDPVLRMLGTALRAAPALRWVGYLSSTGVYGDRGGAWVDETTAPAPGSEAACRRLVAEESWAALADRAAVDLFRVAGIYGPGRSALDAVRAGQARRIIKPGHAFARIHRDDIARAVLAAAAQPRAAGVRVLHLADDEPAENAAVIEEAAALVGVASPPAMPFAEAFDQMGPLARGFWSENRRVGNAATKTALGISWLYPSYREGLRAILRAGG